MDKTLTIKERMAAAGLLNGYERTDPWEEVMMPLGIIHLSEPYQRRLDHLRVQKIVREWTPMLWTPPDVNWRENGEFYCCDGQHRITARLEVEGKDAHGPVRLFVGLTYEQEADLWGGNDYRKPPSPLERFNAKIEAKKEPYLSIERIVHHTGWRITRSYQSGQHYDQDRGIASVVSLERIYRRQGANQLIAVLNMLRECFGNDMVPKQALIDGMAQFMLWYEHEYNEKAFIRKVRGRGWSTIKDEADIRRGLDHVTATEAIGMILVSIYNKGLPPEKQIDEWLTKRRKRAVAKREMK